LGRSFLHNLESELSRSGWSAGESLGLLAAAEERCGLWMVSPRLPRGVRVQVWRSGRFVDAGCGLAALAHILAAAPSGQGLPMIAVSGAADPPPGVVRELAQPDIQVGRMAGGLARQLGLRWAVEAAIVPALGPGALAGLRERINSAPRCAWCHVPVLGSSCTRCRGGAV
jgi:hypothetical protein